jgi:hypothetical protein
MDSGLSSAGHMDVAFAEPFTGVQMRSTVRLSVGIIRSFIFLCGIRIAMTCHHISPALGGFLADRFGITASLQRARRWLPQPGRPN